jgi:hypothetical protein
MTPLLLLFPFLHFGQFILTRLVSVGLFISIVQKIYQGSNAFFFTSVAIPPRFKEEIFFNKSSRN